MVGKAWQGRAFLKSSHTSHIFGLCLVNLFHRRKANHLSSGVNNHKMNAYQLCSGKCLITGSSTGLKSSYLYLICMYLLSIPVIEILLQQQSSSKNLKSQNVVMGGGGRYRPLQPVQAGSGRPLLATACQEQGGGCILSLSFPRAACEWIGICQRQGFKLR